VRLRVAGTAWRALLKLGDRVAGAAALKIRATERTLDGGVVRMQSIGRGQLGDGVLDIGLG